MKPLPRILEDPAQASPLEARIAAALALGADDPRAGASVVVPAGRYLRGSDPPEGASNEHPRHWALTGAYEIDLLPVTVARFARFVARGYSDRALWTDQGWNWRTQTGVAAPRFWEEEAWSAYLHPGHPVVGVSFYEAEAYARFAGRRLPTEAEWERAARGEDGRRYPWGDAWDPSRAAHRGGPRHTLPAGCFPAGRSPHGLWDAAGNIWEWVQDLFDPEAYRRKGPFAASPSAARVARGGAWNALPEQLRCANRNAWVPAARYSNIGFRTAR